MVEGAFDRVNPAAVSCAKCGPPHDLTGMDGDPADMWRAVVRQALADSREAYPPRRQAAILWLQDTEYAPGSFTWICHHTGQHPEAFLKKYGGAMALPTPEEWEAHHKKDAERCARNRAAWAASINKNRKARTPLTR